MLPDRVSNPRPLTYESGALPIALRDPAHAECVDPKESICTKQKPRLHGFTDGFKCSQFSYILSSLLRNITNCCFYW